MDLDGSRVRGCVGRLLRGFFFYFCESETVFESSSLSHALSYSLLSSTVGGNAYNPRHEFTNNDGEEDEGIFLTFSLFFLEK